MSKALTQKIGQAFKAVAKQEIKFDFENIPIHVQNASFHKVLNWLKVEAAITFKRKKPWGWPTYLQIEPTTRCNFRCPFCPVSQDLGEPIGNMDFETFQQVIDDVGLYTLLIVLWGWGEPFLNTAIYDMIAYAKKKNIKLVSSTNGQLFYKEKYAESLVKSGLDGLIVSIGGTTQQTSQLVRAGGKLELIFQGVRNIVKYKKLLKSNTPTISLTFITTKHNEEEIEELKRVAKSLDVDILNIKKMNTSTTKSKVTSQEKSLLPSDSELQRFEYDEVSGERVRVKHNPCKALWHSPTIRFDGRINACAYDFHGKYQLGDVKQGSIKNYWFGELYRNMRNQFRSNWEQFSTCNNCTYAYKGGDYDEVFANTFYLK